MAAGRPAGGRTRPAAGAGVPAGRRGTPRPDKGFGVHIMHGTHKRGGPKAPPSIVPGTEGLGRSVPPPPAGTGPTALQRPTFPRPGRCGGSHTQTLKKKKTQTPKSLQTRDVVTRNISPVTSRAVTDARRRDAAPSDAAQRGESLAPPRSPGAHRPAPAGGCRRPGTPTRHPRRPTWPNQCRDFASGTARGGSRKGVGSRVGRDGQSWWR